MQQRFELNIAGKNLFGKTDRLLVALSGGVDSVVLSFLLKAGAYNFSLAHCNFKLRGRSSDADERFCKELAATLGVEIHITRFDTKSYSKEKGISTQMAARELRYNWFARLIQEHAYSHLLTAHHAGDNTETVLINLLRGTGINGLKGIAPKSGTIIRPLLNFTKDEILAYSKKHKISYREDKSNSETKYLRNFLRLKVIPALKKIRPDVDELFLENSRRFGEESEIINHYVEEKLSKLLIRKNGAVIVKRELLLKEKFHGTLVHCLVSPFGFNETQQKNIIENVLTKSISGKKYFSSTHELQVERNELVISPIEFNSEEFIEIRSLDELSRVFSVSNVSATGRTNPDELLLDVFQIVFPLTIRKAVRGDKFMPFGMKGFKLISDFYKDKKLGSQEKKKIRLLVNGNGEIIWVIGYRSDERYRVSGNSREIIKLKTIERTTGNI